MTHFSRLYKKKIYSLFYVGMFCSLIAQSQIKISIKYFEGTTWAASDKDSSFFKSDTIRFVRLMVKASHNFDNSNDVAGYFSDGDFVTMEFQKTGELVFITTKVDSWSIVKKRGKYFWKFNNKHQTLRLYFNNKLFATLKPIHQKKVQIESEYTDRPPTTTVEITMKKLFKK